MLRISNRAYYRAIMRQIRAQLLLVEAAKLSKAR